MDTMKAIGILLVLSACTVPPAIGPDASTREEPVAVHLLAEEVARGHWRAHFSPGESWREWTACTSGEALAVWLDGAMLAQGGPCITHESGALEDVALDAGNRYRFVMVGTRPQLDFELLSH
jgi:hypothetical protein